jgi:lambda family phage tail tape measure protein
LAGELYDLTEIREQDAEATQAQVQAQQEMNQAIARLSESYQDAVAGAEAFVKNKQAEYEFQNQINTAVGVQRDFLEEMAEFDRERINNLEQLKVAAEEAAAAGVTGAMDQYNAAVQAYEAQRELFAEQAKQQAELQNSFSQGWKESIASLVDSFKPYNQAQNAIQKGWGAISDAVDNFTKTGKFKFKDFALSAIADITSMVLKAQLLKGITGGLSLFGFKLPGLAAGGPAQGNKPYIVGEQGPELFVPKSSGTVVPNGQLGGMQQPQVNNTYVTNNINAVDAKSVAQLFVENRKTLLGATMMARKEMPYGMG